MRAARNGQVIAEPDATIVVEGDHYFPPEAAAEIAGHVAFWHGVTVEPGGDARSGSGD